MKEVRMTKNPLTDRYERAEWVPNHFAYRVYGVRFADGSIYNPAQVPLKVK